VDERRNQFRGCATQPRLNFPLKLSFTPPASGNYLLLFSSSISNSSTNYATSVQILQNNTQIFVQSYIPISATDYVILGFTEVIPLTGGNAYTFQVQISTGNAAGITYENNSLEIPGHATSPGGKNLLEIVDNTGDLGTTLIINTAEAVGDGEKAVAEVLSIRTRSGYTEKDFNEENPEIGEVASAVCLELNTLPENARVIINTALEPDPAVGSAFQLVTGSSGLGEIYIAYTINVEKVNIANGTHIHCATITMVVSQEWVAANGGNDAVRIIRYDEQSNEPRILETTFVGYDTQNRAVFEGFSPGGLSVFALVGTTAPADTSDQNEKLNDFQTRVIIIFSVIGGAALVFCFFLLFKKRRKRKSNSD